jgi:hypothetical protein
MGLISIYVVSNKDGGKKNSMHWIRRCRSLPSIPGMESRSVWLKDQLDKTNAVEASKHFWALNCDFMFVMYVLPCCISCLNFTHFRTYNLCVMSFTTTHILCVETKQNHTEHCCPVCSIRGPQSSHINAMTGYSDRGFFYVISFGAVNQKAWSYPQIGHDHEGVLISP